jgi:long-subunit fatty acid transport protein
MRTLLALLCFAPATALAGGFFIPNPNARELALAQSDVAAQTGPEAVSMNAAALAGRAGLAVSATGQMLANQSSWQDASLGSAKTLNGPVFPPAIYASYGGKLPNDMAFGIGAGFHVMGGGSMEWPTGWPGATRIQKVTQNAFQTTVGAGLAVLPQLKLGASLVYYRVVEELSQQISFASSVGNATLGLAGGDFSFGLGAELAVPKLPVTIGASYRHQGSMTLSGKVHFEQVPAAFQAQLLDQGAKSDLILPSELFVGFAWRTVKTVRVMGSWSWENWKKYGEDKFVGDKGLTIAVPRHFTNAYVFRLGVEYEKVASLPLTLRVGGMRSISNQPSATASPTLLDAPSWSASAGAGYDILGGLRADVGYQYTWFDNLTASGEDAFPGSYDTRVHFLSLGLTYRMKI